MENNPHILEFMQSEVQFFQELISDISGDNVVMVEVDAPKSKSKSTKDFKPVKESARYDKEKDKYNKKPLDPNYFNEYYRQHNVLIECDFCGRQTPKLTLARHKRTNKCKKLACSIQESNHVLNSLD